MKNLIFTYKEVLGLLVVFTILVGCERELSDDAVLATFPNTAEIFNDAPVGLTDEFFESFDPAVGANTNGFGTDNNVAFEGNSSIRIDVPAPNDPDGGFIGGIFRDRGEGRNLTQYDALTFWAKGSTTATIGLFGFGTDFVENEHAVALNDVLLSTDWKKYIIPMPDPSKYVQERGMFIFSAGTQSTNGFGYTFWIDELKFEKTGIIAQPQPSILGGVDVVEESFNGSVLDLGVLVNQTFNVDGRNVTTFTTTAFFEFESSNPSVASVDQDGVVTVLSEGTAKITATLNGVVAKGSYEVTSNGDFPTPIVPMRPAANVKSIFSDAYVSETAFNFDPRFGGSTTQTTLSNFAGNSVLSYTANNFTGIIFENSVDASAMSFMHVDVFTRNPGTSVEFQIRDIGGNGELETNTGNGFPDGDDKDFRFTASGLTQGEWTSVEIPLGGDLTSQKANIGAVILVGGPDFILDNIYFYTE